MLWTKNYHKIGFGILLSAFFAVFSSFFFLNTNVSAVADISYTFDFDNIPSWYDLCQGSSDCSSYSYLLVEPSVSCASLCSFVISGISSTNTAVSASSSSLYFLFSPSALYLTGGRTGSYSGSITITLFESYGSAPSGSITLTENGTFDVSSYATAVVDVPPTIEQGDYHDDLISIQQAIYVCGAILLVLYFFYCIYRMIIKTTGGYL